MPQGRPAIPEEIKRSVFVEFGHCCAVDGQTSGLEIAHIKPWSRCRSHELPNLILLCVLCHRRAHTERWGQKTLMAYKKRPWVRTRENQSHELVTLRIPNIDLSRFGPQSESVFLLSLATLLGVKVSDIEVESKEAGGVLITLALPQKAASELKAYALSGASELGAIFAAVYAVAEVVTSDDKPASAAHFSVKRPQMRTKVRRYQVTVVLPDFSCITTQISFLQNLARSHEFDIDPVTQTNNTLVFHVVAPAAGPNSINRLVRMLTESFSDIQVRVTRLRLCPTSSTS